MLIADVGNKIEKNTNDINKLTTRVEKANAVVCDCVFLWLLLSGLFVIGNVFGCVYLFIYLFIFNNNIIIIILLLLL